MPTGLEAVAVVVHVGWVVTTDPVCPFTNPVMVDVIVGMACARIDADELPPP